MRNNVIVCFFLLCFVEAAHCNDLIIDEVDINNLYQPTDDDFKKINRHMEYLNAKKKLYSLQQDLLTTTNTGSSNPLENDSHQGNGVPRNLRGRSSGDSYIDSDGNKVILQKAPEANVRLISSFNGKYVADIFWIDREFPVEEGDSLLGGNWIVKSIDMSGVVMFNKSNKKLIKLSSVPVNVSDLLNN